MPGPFSPASLRRLRSHALERIRFVALLTLFVGSSFADRAAWGDLWWDTNGLTAGASNDSSPEGYWTDANWSLDSAGTSATQAWSPGETAVFSAGTNGKSFYDVVFAANINVAGLRLEEGSPRLWSNPGGVLTFTNGSLLVDTRAGTLEAYSLFGPSNGVVTKVGPGTFYASRDQTSFAGKWIVNEGILGSTNLGLGVLSPTVVPDAITINNGAGVSGFGNDRRGITLGPGGGGFTFLDTTAPLTSMDWYGPIRGTSGAPFIIQFHGIVTYGNSNNSYDGDTIIKDGIVNLAATNTFPATTNVKIVGATTTDLKGFSQTINSLSMVAGSYLNLTPTTIRPTTFPSLTLQNPSGETIAGKISGGGELVKNGAGTVTISGDNGAYGFTLNSGTAGVGHDHAFGATSGFLTINGGTLANTSSIARSIGTPLNINGDFSVDSSLNATPGKLSFFGTATFNATHTVTVGANASLVLSDLKQSAAGAGLTKAGAGTLEIQKIQSSTTNLLSGPITVAAGRLRLLGNAPLGTGANELNLAGGTFDVTSSSASLNNPLKVTADSAVTTSSNAASIGLYFTTDSVSGTGKLTIRNDSPIVGSVFGAYFQGISPTFAPGPIEIANGALGTTVLHSRNSLLSSEIFANEISGNAGFDVFGTYYAPPNTGATILLAGNTYSGGTTVSGGLLLVNNTAGSGTGTGPVSVSTAGRLGGTGVISGAVTNGGTIAPGASIGTLTMTSSVAMNGGSHLAIELSGATADKLVVGGNLDLSAAEFLDVTGSGVGPWVIATYGGSLSGTFDNVTPGYVVDYTSPGQIILNSMALPGDYNNDGVVDATDYVAWRKTPNAYSGDPAGFTAWRANFGKTAGGAGATAVPEPAALVLIVTALVAVRRASWRGLMPARSASRRG